MKILHLSRFYRPDPGGVERVVGQLAEGAGVRGHEVRVVAATGSGWARDPGTRVTEPPRANVVVVRLPTYGILWSQPIAPGYLAAVRWPADVTHLHHPHPLADLAAMTAPRRPLVITHHADISGQALARPVYWPWVRGALKRADAIVVATQSHVAVSGELEGFEAKVRVIPFGVDPNFFHPGDHARPPCFGDESSGPVGLFVGRLVPYKGLDVLLDALHGTDLRVVLVGGGPERPRLEARVAQLGLEHQVVFAGEIPDGELPSYYQAAAYVVLPSVTTQEMFGIVLLEAMAMERPLITTALTTGVREVNERDVTGLHVPAGDVDALRAALRRLASDEPLRRTMGAAGRARVLERFTLNQMVDEYLTLYGELVNR